MTTQTVNVDAFGYTGTFGAKLRDPDTIATLVATADTVAASGTIASRFVCTFGEVAVIAAGEYLLEFIVNGVSSILYVTLTGVDGEVALARSERAAVLDSATATKIDSIKTKTDNLPADPADASDIASSFGTVNGKLDTIDDLIDTEVSAITTEVAKIPKVGSTHRYTQVASDSGAKRADVSITDTP